MLGGSEAHDSHRSQYEHELPATLDHRKHPLDRLVVLFPGGRVSTGRVPGVLGRARGLGGREINKRLDDPTLVREQKLPAEGVELVVQRPERVDAVGEEVRENAADEKRNDGDCGDVAGFSAKPFAEP